MQANQPPAPFLKKADSQRHSPARMKRPTFREHRLPEGPLRHRVSQSVVFVIGDMYNPASQSWSISSAPASRFRSPF